MQQSKSHIEPLSMRESPETPREMSKKSSCRTIGCVKSAETNATIGADEIDRIARGCTYKTQVGNTGGLL